MYHITPYGPTLCLLGQQLSPKRQPHVYGEVHLPGRMVPCTHDPEGELPAATLKCNFRETCCGKGGEAEEVDMMQCLMLGLWELACTGNCLALVTSYHFTVCGCIT